jgi:hypothetical protein
MCRFILILTYRKEQATFDSDATYLTNLQAVMKTINFAKR